MPEPRWRLPAGRRAALGTLLTLIPLAAPAATAAPLADPRAVGRARLAQGDAAWARRAEGYGGELAAPGPIAAAVLAYEQAVKLDPTALEGYWKLQRALWFQGEYTTGDSAARRRIYDHGRHVSERALDVLARQAGGRQRLDALSATQLRSALTASAWAAHVYLGAAAHWGLWAQASGPFAAIRQGALARVRDYVHASLAIDPHLQDGAAYRLLGRLYTRTPQVPLLSGWIDREQGVAALRRAWYLDPLEPTNRLFLAEAMLAERPADAEGLGLLRGLLGLVPRPEWLVEDTTVRQQAEALLARAIDP